MDVLGPTIQHIASHKAGIMKVCICHTVDVRVNIILFLAGCAMLYITTTLRGSGGADHSGWRSIGKINTGTFNAPPHTALSSGPIITSPTAKRLCCRRQWPPAWYLNFIS